MSTTPTSSIGVLAATDVRTPRDTGPPMATPATAAVAKPSRAADSTSSGSAPSEPAAATAALKLVVAKAHASSAYIYTLVDPVSGRVVAEIPQEQAAKSAADPSYAAGGVVDTTA